MGTLDVRRRSTQDSATGYLNGAGNDAVDAQQAPELAGELLECIGARESRR